MAQKPTKTRASANAQTESKIKAAARPRQRAVQERAEITIEKIRAAATRLFAERGYDGTSIREVENVAGVNRGLVNYHFDNKEALWKAALDQVFGLLETHTKDRAELYRDLPPKERIAYVIRSQVRFNAAHPELNQLMMQEAKSDTPRLHLRSSDNGMAATHCDGSAANRTRRISLLVLHVSGQQHDCLLYGT